MKTILSLLLTFFHLITSKQYSRVLSGIQSVAPSIFEKDHQTKDGLTIYINRKCADQTSIKDVVKALLNDLKGIVELKQKNSGFNGDGIFGNLENYIILVKVLDSDKLNDLELDFSKRCVSKITWEGFSKVSQITQCSPRSDSRLWNLQALLKGNSFSRLPTNNVDIYVLDTVINLNHPEFTYLTTRQRLGGQTGINNHGSHVAGTIMGRTVGILSDSRVPLFSYGVCTGGGFCFDNDLFAGLQAVLNNMRSRPGRKGIINMSLGGRCTVCNKYDSYFAQLRAAGATIVVSAGNSRTDACGFEPAGEPDAISVGSYQNGNPFRRSSFSNFGPCVDTWGPGSSVYSALYNTGSYGFLSGTSMASPAIAGLVGAFLSINPTLTYTQIKNILKCPTCSYTTLISDARSANNVSFSLPCNNVPSLLKPPSTTTTTTTKPITTNIGNGCRCLNNLKNKINILNPFQHCSFSSTNEILDLKIDFGQVTYGALLVINDKSCKSLENDDKILLEFNSLTDIEFAQCKRDLFQVLSNTDCGVKNGRSSNAAKLAKQLRQEAMDSNIIGNKNNGIILNGLTIISIVLLILVCVSIVLYRICKKNIGHKYEIVDVNSNIESDSSIIQVKN